MRLREGTRLREGEQEIESETDQLQTYKFTMIKLRRGSGKRDGEIELLLLFSLCGVGDTLPVLAPSPNGYSSNEPGLTPSLVKPGIQVGAHRFFCHP